MSPEMSNTTDLSALRIDRSNPAPSGGGPNRVPLVIGVGLLIAIAAFAVVNLWPRTLEVEVGIASATGGGVASGAGISANGYVVARTKASVSSKILGRLARHDARIAGRRRAFGKVIDHGELASG